MGTAGNSCPDHRAHVSRDSTYDQVSPERNRHLSPQSLRPQTDAKTAHTAGSVHVEDTRVSLETHIRKETVSTNKSNLEKSGAAVNLSTDAGKNKVGRKTRWGPPIKTSEQSTYQTTSAGDVAGRQCEQRRTGTAGNSCPDHRVYASKDSTNDQVSCERNRPLSPQVLRPRTDAKTPHTAGSIQLERSDIATNHSTGSGDSGVHRWTCWGLPTETSTSAGKCSGKTGQECADMLNRRKHSYQAFMKKLEASDKSFSQQGVQAFRNFTRRTEETKSAERMGAEEKVVDVYYHEKGDITKTTLNLRQFKTYKDLMGHLEFRLRNKKFTLTHSLSPDGPEQKLSFMPLDQWLNFTPSAIHIRVQ